MGFLERAIKRGISNAVGNAVEGAVQKAVQPKADELANRAADSIDQATRYEREQAERQAKAYNGAFGNLQRSVEDYATERAKNMKLCPACEEPTTADKSFCPRCGAKLPDTTMAQEAVCTACGKQNALGTMFCTGCGTKLPGAIAAEQAVEAKKAAVMAQWDVKLPMYPKWCQGGFECWLEEIEPGIHMFSVDFKGNNQGAQMAVEQYRQYAMEKGFRMAGEYPNKQNLYNKINGVCYHLDTEHCFDGDSDRPTIYFNIQEPNGGYDYVKPEPKKKASFFDLFKNN